MKNLLFLLLLLTGCKTAASAPIIMGVEVLDAQGSVVSFVRSDTVIFVGQGQVGLNAYMVWKGVGIPVVPPKSLQAGELLVVNREIDETLNLKPGDPVPAYVLEVMLGSTPVEKIADATRLGLVLTPQP